MGYQTPPKGRLGGFCGFRKRDCGYRCWLCQVQAPSSLAQPRERRFQRSLQSSNKAFSAQGSPRVPRTAHPNLLHIRGTEQRDHRSCSLNGSDSTWKKTPSSQRFATHQSFLLASPSAVSQHSNPTGTVGPGAPRAGHSSCVVRLGSGY